MKKKNILIIIIFLICNFFAGCKINKISEEYIIQIYNLNDIDYAFIFKDKKIHCEDFTINDFESFERYIFTAKNKKIDGVCSLERKCNFIDYAIFDALYEKDPDKIYRIRGDFDIYKKNNRKIYRLKKLYSIEKIDTEITKGKNGMCY